MSDGVSREPVPEILTLRRMAARLGVTASWLREQAEAKNIPGVRAGNRWLFAPDVVRDAVRAMAGDRQGGTQ
jgi:excisionase family DNA binding protein